MERGKSDCLPTTTSAGFSVGTTAICLKRLNHDGACIFGRAYTFVKTINFLTRKLDRFFPRSVLSDSQLIVVILGKLLHVKQRAKEPEEFKASRY